MLVIRINRGGTCPPVIVPTGIAYQRPMRTGQTTIYRVGDDAWNEANEPYSDPPPNPTHTAQLDLGADPTGLTLKANNAFGNLDRFTDSIGGQIAGAGNGSLVDYWIDHLTGIGYDVGTIRVENFNGQCDTPQASVLHGFMNWKCWNNNELDSILRYELTQRLNYAPYNIVSGAIGTTTTDNSLTTNRYYFQESTNGRMLRILKTTARAYLFCRNHY